MMTIEVDITEDCFSCPLRSDVNSCGAIPLSPINHCPHTETDDDGLMVWSAPDDCPLRDGGVEITMKDEA